MFALSDAREYSFSQVPYLEREEIHAKFSSGDDSSFGENWLTVIIDMFAPKWARGPRNLARFPSWDPCITPRY